MRRLSLAKSAAVLVEHEHRRSVVESAFALLRIGQIDALQRDDPVFLGADEVSLFQPVAHDLIDLVDFRPGLRHDDRRLPFAREIEVMFRELRLLVRQRAFHEGAVSAQPVESSLDVACRGLLHGAAILLDELSLAPCVGAPRILPANFVQLGRPKPRILFDRSQRIRSLDGSVLSRVTRRNETPVHRLHVSQQSLHLLAAKLTGFIQDHDSTPRHLPSCEEFADGLSFRESIGFEVDDLLALRSDNANVMACLHQSIPYLAQRKALARARAAAKQRHEIAGV